MKTSFIGDWYYLNGSYVVKETMFFRKQSLKETIP